ncbi:MAG: hypothetical protein E6K70_24310, partial [Planctomycetota bacterium]
MSTEHATNAERESRLNDVLLSYLEAVQVGKAPERRQLLDRYPEFAAELREFFTLRDQISRLASPLREVALSGGLAGEPSAPDRPGFDFPDDRAPKTSARSGAASVELGPIGEFRLLREIGRGGMGVVYEAYQTSLNRRVALKVLPFAAALDPKQLARFQNEAQAAARLHHTNIVPVFAISQERGVHYYAMQLIDGQSLASLLDELRRHEPTRPARPGNLEALSGAGAASGPPAAALQPPAAAAHAVETSAAQLVSFSTERSLRKSSFFQRIAQLIRTAAEALEHAHQAGVVHRD